MSVDTLPRELLNQYEISNIKVLYKHEAIDESSLHIYSNVLQNIENKLTTVHAIFNDNKDKAITKLELKWRKI